MKYEKETTGPKNPNVTVKKSAFEEFLDEFGSWRGKRTGEKIADSIRKRQAEENLPTAERIKLKRKRERTKFMDSGFMLLIKFLVGIVEFGVTMVTWVFSFFFSFKGIAIIAALIYFLDVDINAIVTEEVKEQAIEMTDDAKAQLKELKKEHAVELKEKATTTFDSLKSVMEGFAESVDGLEINIKKTDGTVINFGGDGTAEGTETPTPTGDTK
ncbi:MAG: hypothetical protein ACTSX2_04025 [Candidatus Thorarchaeota archaeon]